MEQKTTLEIIAPTWKSHRGDRSIGTDVDVVSVEALDAGTKGFLGLGKPQVRVRLTVNPAGGAADVQTESAPAPRPEAERLGTKPAAVADARQGAPVISVPAEKEPESQPEHDALLDRTESVISKILHLLNLEAQVSANYGPTERDGRRNIHVVFAAMTWSVLIGRHPVAAFQPLLP
jgi:predicted RNA-binding protein Jag